jgi:hypothetical protein
MTWPMEAIVFSTELLGLVELLSTLDAPKGELTSSWKGFAVTEGAGVMGFVVAFSRDGRPADKALGDIMLSPGTLVRINCDSWNGNNCYLR